MRYGRLTPDVVVKARYTNQASLIKPGGYKTMKALYLCHCQSLAITSLVNYSLLPEPSQPSRRVSSRQQRHEIPISDELRNAPKDNAADKWPDARGALPVIANHDLGEGYHDCPYHEVLANHLDGGGDRRRPHKSGSCMYNLDNGQRLCACKYRVQELMV